MKPAANCSINSALDLGLMIFLGALNLEMKQVMFNSVRLYIVCFYTIVFTVGMIVPCVLLMVLLPSFVFCICVILEKVIIAIRLNNYCRSHHNNGAIFT